MAWVFALINIPGFLIALAAIWFWPITIPGMILFASYWRSAFDKLTYSQTEGLWIWTIVYNLFLLVTGSLILGVDGGSWEMWPALVPSVFGATMAGIALRALKDHRENTLAVKENDLNMGEYLSANENHRESGIKPIRVENWHIA